MEHYYYIDRYGKQMGPVTLEALKNAGLTPDTLVWHTGLPRWVRAADIQALRPLFGTGAYPPPPYGRPAAQQPLPREAREGRDRTQPKTYLLEAILVTIFCFLPFGIVGIVYATKVSTLLDMGEYEKAWDASRKARLWTLWSIGVMLIFWAVVLLFALIAYNGQDTWLNIHNMFMRNPME